MDLKTYLRTLSVEQKTDFAARVGASLSHIKFVAYGVKNPSCELAMNIDGESGGAVPAELLRPDANWHYIRAARSRKAA